MTTPPSVMDRFLAARAASGIKRNKFSPTSAGPHIFKVLKFKTTPGNKKNGKFWILECLIERSPDGLDNGQAIDIMIEQETNNGATEELREIAREKDVTRFKGYCASALGIDLYDEETLKAVVSTPDFYRTICEDGYLDGAYIGVNVSKAPAFKWEVDKRTRQKEKVYQFEAPGAPGEDPKPVYWTNLWPMTAQLDEGFEVDLDNLSRCIGPKGPVDRLAVTATARP